MHIRIVAVGTRMPEWVVRGYEDYARRLPREFDLKLIEVPAAQRSSGGDPRRARAIESERILKTVGSASLIALDERGESLGTRAWAKELSCWMVEGNDVALVVGGADGLDSKVMQRARSKWSLSALTLPHALVRVVLVEQLYRAWSLNAGHPYHRD